ncbi:MAG TPA: amino acid--tRNA ligase-related protein [Acidobacteriota bacterium]|nr:amino acid--tRNA ligase-related protein [Acidobacteriota bacterium]
MNKNQIYDRVLKALWQWAAETDHQFRPTPRIVTATGACENVDTLWAIDSDNVPGHFFFAQTGQLYLEMALAEVPRVFTVGSSGRAEAEIDSRHLREFTLLEVEGRGGFNDLVATIRSLFSAIDQVSAEWGAAPIASRMQLLTYSEALEALGWDSQRWGDDMSHAEETALCADGPVLLTHHPDPQPVFGPAPALEKFFNMKPTPTHNGDRPTVQSCDLLLPLSGESLGGAVRIHQSDILRERLQRSQMFATLQRRGLGMAQFADYFGHMDRCGERIGEHYGFGVGLDRVVQYLMGATDIRRSAGFLVNMGDDAVPDFLSGNGHKPALAEAVLQEA